MPIEKMRGAHGNVEATFLGMPSLGCPQGHEKRYIHPDFGSWLAPIVWDEFSKSSTTGFVTKQQGSILGDVQAIGSLGRVPGPIVAGLLYEQINPAAPFLVSASLMAVGFAMTLLVYRESRRAVRGLVVAGASGDE